MAFEVVMPRLGWTMETGRLVEWLKQEGEAVEAGENLFTVESDKAVVEVEALDSGVLRIPPNAPAADTDIAVGTVLAYLLLPGEAVPWDERAVPSQPDGQQSATAPPPQLDEDPGVVAADAEAGTMPANTAATNGRMASDAMANARRPNASAMDSTVDGDRTQKGKGEAVRGRAKGGAAISPRGARVAAELGVDWRGLQGSGKTGRIRERDIRAAHAKGAIPVRATPLARRVAADNGVDLREIAAKGKRIARADVDAVLPSAPGGAVEGMPLSPTRRIIAARMAESARAAAPVTLTTEADATELVALRERIKADREGDVPIPSFNDFMVRVAALALGAHPALNATLHDNRIVEHEAVHVGVAVDTPRGLLVPVVRDAGTLSVGQIAVHTARLIERARAGRATPEELTGGTFTITNLGMYEIDAFTPIINLPECAILGVGRIVARPVVVDEKAMTVAVRRMMALSLTFDHRIVDGAPAARFLQHIKQLVEHPYRWVV